MTDNITFVQAFSFVGVGWDARGEGWNMFLKYADIE